MFGFGHKKEESLTEEQLQLITRAETLIARTKELTKKEGIGNLTSSWTLRDDCQLVEQMIKKLRKSPGEENAQKLANAVTRLQTTSENILNWKFTE